MTVITSPLNSPTRRAHLRAVEPGRQTNLHRIVRDRSRRDQLERLRLFAATRASPPVFAYWSAAVIHDLPLLHSPPRTIHVLASGSRARAAQGVVMHPGRVDVPPALRRGLRVTSPAQTVAALAGRTSFVDGVVIADRALAAGAFGERTPLATRAEIVASAEALPDAAERSRALAVARFADGRAESPLESVSRATMALAGAPPPDLQVAVHDLFGLVGRVDFCWAGLALAGEADGAAKLLHPVFRGSRDGWELLEERTRRQERIESAGLRVIRWRWETGRRVDRMREFLAREGVPLDSRARREELGLGA
ncbi:hypothetical protein [Leifsonia sp. TF02-11]|uniref:hypothetical protein n=1 Tax=Leifsonia sp. TF02-11 TaxID=2815212 RepID=UPI001AA15745|nr:hypothetical protein [Leifsonia sp. TF02-11]MBO1740318.1 hypothetical protein [Leifsonia sp. TF02-11]